MKPSSFCSMSTLSCWEELYGLLLSLSLHHPGEKVFLIVDTPTKMNIEKMTPILKLDIKWSILLDQYTGLDRDKMNAISETYWTEFQLKKITIMKIALKECNDTLFMDSDMLILDEINDIDKTKLLGVSPHYINNKSCSLYGYYNGGLIWTSKSEVLDDWVEFTKKSRYHEQSSIEDLVSKYYNSYFDFGENYNFSWWRVFQSDSSPQEIINYLTIIEETINYKNKPLKLIHTHFQKSISVKDSHIELFNLVILNILTNSKEKYYKHLLIINKIININWVLKMPEKMYNNNLELYKKVITNKDVEISLDNSIDEISLFDIISLINFNKFIEDSNGDKNWNIAPERILYGNINQ